ncbi:hypothetical protein AYO49_03005 [Verrucomicrobiaceae bacterium SCGC AG-212-N21]|nr:hypothetical protein AYO49_03005 [Verrucomicrobiaceae bacterium SCGC AG-212-N21]
MIESPSIATTEAEPSNRVHYGCLVPSSADYFTQLVLFPGNNAHKPWGENGNFTLQGHIYVRGKEIAAVAPQSCSEQGHLKLDFETPLKAAGKDVEGLCLLSLDSVGGIPVEIYLSHIHRKTGVYFAYPALMYMGDTLYPRFHVAQLENSMFWPGFPSQEDTEFRLAVLNPYKVPMSVDISLWHNAEGRHSVGIKRISPHDHLFLSLDEIMPESWRQDGDGAASLGVTAQFKLLAYMMTVNRRTGIISSADHLHPYQVL